MADAPKKEVTILPGEPMPIIVESARLVGKMKFAAGCIVHPTASILATNGPIEFGENNLVEEQVIIENLSSTTLIIGSNNVFEIGASVRAASIGKNNTFGVRCNVEDAAQISEGCSIGPNCLVKVGQILNPRTCIYGECNAERISKEEPQSGTSQMDLLRLVLPKYHKILK